MLAALCGTLGSQPVMAGEKIDSIGIKGIKILFPADDNNIKAMTVHMARELNTSKYRLLPATGQGAWQSVLDLLTFDDVSFAVVQGDHLGYARLLERFGDIEEKIVPIGTMTQAAIHIVARRDISALADLQGEKVNFGSPAGTWLTAETAFKEMNIDVEPTAFTTEEALASVKSGRLAAAVIVSSVPMDNLQAVLFDENLHLLSMPELGNSFGRISFSDADYPGLLPLGTRLTTASVPLILAAYNWPASDETRLYSDEIVFGIRSKLAKWKVSEYTRDLFSNAMLADLPGWMRW